MRARSIPPLSPRTTHPPALLPEVINASTDIMGNHLLGIHGSPPRSAETTLKEVWGAIPPIRKINGARIWTANRWSAVDATFGTDASNQGAGTPSPKEASAVLTGLGSSTFNYEGLIGSDLPILLLNFPLKGSASHWPDCHFADALSPSLLMHLLNVEGGAAE